MSHPSDFYKLQIEIHSEELQKIKRQLMCLSRGHNVGNRRV